MRTTITLGDDVAAAIAQRRRSGRSLREVINEALRFGLARQAEPSTGEPVRTRSVSPGGCRLPDIDNIADVLAITEGKARR
jgi:hypothetical protein